jgi:UDP-galactopyranose mutase
MYDFLIIGCGFSGATLAERIASQLGKKVLIIDQRNHIGGNVYDYYDDAGILVSKYGAHIFHTNDEKVWRYLSQFTDLNNYVHHVEAFWKNKFFALPLNLETINIFFGKQFTSAEMAIFLEKIRIPIKDPKNAEEAVLNKVGWELYEAFYKNYTKKQWGVDPKELAAEVTMRLPIRMNGNKQYFSDKWQGVPPGGFTKVFERMLNQKKIHILLNADFKDIVNTIPYRRLIFTGPIDAFFGYCFGKLPYRSIAFRFETFSQSYFQQVGVVNYPNEYDYTRCVEYKQLYQQQHDKTTISRDYPCWKDDEPFYPVPSAANRALYQRYKALADRMPQTYFCGRLGSYAYYNMDQCIGQALTLFEKRIVPDMCISSNRRSRYPHDQRNDTGQSEHVPQRT